RTVQVKARPGYAVGGLTGRAGLLLNGMSLTFMRINGSQLNPDDHYQSDWIGDRKGGSEASIASQGMLVVGIHGKDGDVECQSLALLHVASPKLFEQARPAEPRRPSVPPRLESPAPKPVEQTRPVEIVREKK